jgi:MFS family permease
VVATDEEELTEGGIWSARYAPVTLANLTIVAIAAFDGLALVAALPAIADDLGGVALLPWVITAFLATSAVAGIVAGPIIDGIGVRRTFRITGIWFLASSAAAAIAPTMTLLVVARALQGIGGGLVISVALASVGLAYPSRLRPRAFAANSMVWGVMGFGGPVITAGLLSVAGWRMIFVFQLPITALALAAGWRTLPSTRDRPQRVAMDAVGIGLVTALVGASLFAVSQVGVRWWLVGLAMAVAVASTAAFWVHTGRASQPLVERGHITRFPFRRIHLTSGLILAAGLAADNYLPLYMQTTRGRSEAFAAFSVVFLTVGWTTAAFIVSRLLGRWHESDAILFGSCLMLPASVSGGLGIALGWPIPLIFAAFLCMGAAIGFVSTSGLTLLQSAADPAEMGRVNSAHQFIRTLSITYGVAIGGAILLLVVNRDVGDVEVVRDVLGGEDVDTSAVILDAIRDGLAWVHVFSAGVAIACIAAAATLWRLVRARRAAAPDAVAP